MTFLDDMPGPIFLVLDSVVLIYILLISIPIRARLDRTRELDPLEVPSQPDPYAIALLRGGENAALRIAVLDLMQRGYLEVQGDAIGKRKQAGEPQGLPPLQRSILGSFDQPRSAEELFRSELGLARHLADELERFERELRDQRLLSDAEDRTRAWKTAVAMLAISLGLTGLKLFDALGEGRSNIGGLIVLAILAAITIPLAYRPRRLTHRGRTHLDDLVHAYSGLARSSRWNTLEAGDPLLLVAASVLGVSALAGSPLGTQAAVFKKAQAGSGGCGSACGSCGSSGGGGCGSGCGGCGGCGG